MRTLIGGRRAAALLRKRLSGRAPGRILIAAVLTASASAGLAYSPQPHKVVDALGRASGFTVRQIKLTGQEETSSSAIVASLGLGPSTSLLGLDVAMVRERLEGLPWVSGATVRKVLPQTLSVDVSEAEAVARWAVDGQTVLIAADGNVLSESVPARYANLPLVVGKGAAGRVGEAIPLLSDGRALREPPVAAIRIGDRRWDLQLASGALVKLPESAPEAALTRLALLEREGVMTDADGVVVDLRLADRTAVNLAGAADASGQGLVLAGGAATDPLAMAIAANRTAEPLAAAIAEGRAADPLAAIIEELVP